MTTHKKVGHTPGPWHTENYAGEHRIIGPPNGYAYVVARIQKAGSSVKANAALISAAPELLEACKMIIAINDCGCHITNNEIKKIKQAISKAQGEE